MRVLRLGVALIAIAAVTASCGDSPSSFLVSEGDATTTTEVTPTTEATTTTSTTTLSKITTTTRKRAFVPAATTSTTSLRPLVLRKIQVGFGAPCQKTNPSDADGCFFFVQIPNTQRDVRARLHSDRGYDADILVGSNGCDQGATRPQDTQSCERYIGPVYDRQPGDTECFWLTTTDAAYEKRSADFCIVWPQRP